MRTPKKKRNIISDQNDPRAFKVWRSAQIMHAAVGMIKIQQAHELTDTKFKNNQLLNNHIKRLDESIQAISHEVAMFASINDKDEFAYEFAVEMYRLFSYFAMKPTEQISSLMDHIEEMDRFNLEKLNQGHDK